MRFNEMRLLVEYACSGDMLMADVSPTVTALKAAKAEAMRILRNMPDGEERREGFRQLHDLMFRLYGARLCVRKEYLTDGTQVGVYIKADSIANMILCYDC